jgi:hypothetical protein
MDGVPCTYVKESTEIVNQATTGAPLARLQILQWQYPASIIYRLPYNGFPHMRIRPRMIYSY